MIILAISAHRHKIAGIYLPLLAWFIEATHSMLTSEKFTSQLVWIKRRSHMTIPATTATDTKSIESCRSCLYTGVGTCWGLSGYFIYVALFEDRGEKTNSIQKNKKASIINTNSSDLRQSSNAFRIESMLWLLNGKTPPKQNKPFLLAFSAFWAAAGCYRLYLNWCIKMNTLAFIHFDFVICHDFWICSEAVTMSWFYPVWLVFYDQQSREPRAISVLQKLAITKINPHYVMVCLICITALINEF